MLALRRSSHQLARRGAPRNSHQRASLSTSSLLRAGDSGKVKELSREEKGKPETTGGLPEEVPKGNKVHQAHSHSNDPLGSKVPHVVQDAVPEGVERALPESVHPTEGKPASYKKE